MNRSAAALGMSEGQRKTLESIARSLTAPHRLVVRTRALLLAADGVANTLIASQVGVSVPTVRSWRSRFAVAGLREFGRVAEGRGRKPSIPPEKVEEIVRLTQQGKPAGQTHWSCRTMAAATGVSPASVQRIGPRGA